MKNIAIDPVALLIIFCLTCTIKCDSWDNIHIVCPNQCVCQYSHFMDLSIFRWIHGFKKNYITYKNAADDNDLVDTSGENNENDNEAYFKNDNSNENNPMLKYAACMIQSHSNPKDLLIALPQDVQALILLYNSDDVDNITISTSDLLNLMDLTVLEIRGKTTTTTTTTGETIGLTNSAKEITTTSKTLKFIIDEPLPNLEYVNFESIELIGSEKTKRNPNSVHPSENYDYVPDSEKFNYNVSLEFVEPMAPMNGDDDDNDEIEIVPYDVYLQEIKKSKIVSFYGWDKLQVLRIHCSKFMELHWEMFDGLLNLKHLSLEHNDLKVIPPFAFYGALHIKTLSIARNNILDLNYRALAGLLELEYLDLNSNNLTKLSELTFPPFPKLITIDCRHNPIKYIFPMTFGVMNNTRRIYLGSTQNALDLSIGGSSFSSLDQLRELIIENATANILNQQIFKGLQRLERLHIHGSIRKIEFDAFIEMPNLRELYLNDCNIQEVSMDSFYGVKQLEIINLSHNNLTNLPPGVFDEQRSLKEIYLANNNLSKLPLNFFNNTSIKLVRLINNPWVCTCEMTYWKQAITNRQRSKRRVGKQHLNMGNVKPCEKKLNCQEDNNYSNEYSYIFDNKLTPRCDGGPKDIQSRSVYYALRKNLKCSNIDYNHHHHHRQIEIMNRLQQKFNSTITQKYLNFKEYLHHSKKMIKNKLDYYHRRPTTTTTTAATMNLSFNDKIKLSNEKIKYKNQLKYLLNNMRNTEEIKSSSINNIDANDNSNNIF